MSHAGDELARRMRAAVEGFKPPLPGPTVAEVIHRVANVLEEVVRYDDRRRGLDGGCGRGILLACVGRAAGDEVNVGDDARGA